MLDNAVYEVAPVALREGSEDFDAGQTNAPICFVEEIEYTCGVGAFSDDFPGSAAGFLVGRRVYLDAFENNAKVRVRWSKMKVDGDETSIRQAKEHHTPTCTQSPLYLHRFYLHPESERIPLQRSARPRLFWL